MKHHQKEKNLIRLGLFLTAAVLATAKLPAFAQDTTNATTAAVTPAATTTTAPTDEHDWRFAVTLPLWAPQVNGVATLMGQQRDVDISFDKLKDRLDAAFSLGFQVQRDRLGLYSSGSYLKFSGDGPKGAEMKLGIVNGGLSYMLFKTESERPFMLWGTAGVRYWYTDVSMAVTDQAGNSIHPSKVYNLVDPVIGVAATQYITRKLHVDIQGDGGGFNLNNDTDWTWSATGVLSYDFFKWFTLSAGYSALALDEYQGSAARENGFNLVFNGALVKATVNF